MVFKLIAALICAAIWTTSVSAQEYYPDDDLAPTQVVPMVRQRGNCVRAAQQALKMTGGELLSVRPARDGRPLCSVIMLVINAKGRPRKVRVVIPMDF